MSTLACLGISHTPLMGLNPINEAVEKNLHEAIAMARARVQAFAPELVVLIAPDHYNGFFNELMPAFCIGTQASSMGDYLSSEGELNVDGQTALALAESLMSQRFDVAVSRQMLVDHGFAQPLELMWGSLATPPVVPIFLNTVAPPGVLHLKRCQELGKTIGRFLGNESRRTLIIGSGGLSHEPPVPMISDPDPEVRKRITNRRTPTQAEREARVERVMRAGMALASGESAMKPLNPEWDQDWMEGLAGDAHAVNALCDHSEDWITREAGRSAHESKTWLIGRAALPGEATPECLLRYYQAIPEYIAGFGLMMLEPRS